MTWLLAYVSLMLLPVIVLAFLGRREIAAFLKRKSEKRAQPAARSPKPLPQPKPLLQPPQPLRLTQLQELEAKWIAIRAQFLVAPKKALEEAEQLVSELAQARGWLLPGERATDSALGAAASRALRKTNPATSYKARTSLATGAVEAWELMEYFDWIIESLVSSR
jgi:hypothetical protein